MLRGEAPRDLQLRLQFGRHGRVQAVEHCGRVRRRHRQVGLDRLRHLLRTRLDQRLFTRRIPGMEGQQMGAQPDFVRLPDIGVHGNGHMMMLEKNSDDIAAAMRDWLLKAVPAKS